MTENEIRASVVNTMRGWIGLNERDGSHMKIVEIYNNHKPLARGYQVKRSDNWCATAVSAAAIVNGLTDIMPTECSCGRMIELYKQLGRWQENDGYTPGPGDIIMYDWDDTGRGDDKGWPEHVGVVESVSGGRITVIEGNKHDSVAVRSIPVDGKFIRGFCVPDYASKASAEPSHTPAPAPAPAPTHAPKPKGNPVVREWQRAAMADGFSFPRYGADGFWGAECEAVARKAICKLRGHDWRYKELTKIVQRAVGVNADGKFGPATDRAVKDRQKAHGLTPDGDVGINTWMVILGV